MDLSSRDLGGEGGPPLVVLHGILGSSRNWQTAGKDLAIRYHVWALDLRNHGASPHDEEMTYGAMEADLAAWMDARGLARVSLLGHSMGGKVAMRLACRRPERVEKLFVVDIAPRDYDRGGRQRAEFAAMHALDLKTLRSRAEAEQKLEALVPDWALRKFLTTNLERAPEGGWRWTINLAALTAALPDLERNSLEPGDRFEGPALFITGGKSAYVQPADHAAIRRHFPAARIETIPEAGHDPHMQARAEFVRLVLAD
jgi:pimeloyl-ACP methyl ester carboxylesterase